MVRRTQGRLFLKRPDVELILKDHHKAHAHWQRQAKVTRETSAQIVPKFGVLSYAATLLAPTACITENQPALPTPNPRFLLSQSPSRWLLVELVCPSPGSTMPSALTLIHIVTKTSRVQGGGGGGLAAGGSGGGPCEGRMGLSCAGRGQLQPVAAGFTTDTW